MFLRRGQICSIFFSPFPRQKDVDARSASRHVSLSENIFYVLMWEHILLQHIGTCCRLSFTANRRRAKGMSHIYWYVLYLYENMFYDNIWEHVLTRQGRDHYNSIRSRIILSCVCWNMCSETPWEHILVQKIRTCSDTLRGAAKDCDMDCRCVCRDIYVLWKCESMFWYAKKY